MSKNKQMRNQHAKQYIQAVFADRLREEGFTCPDEKLLCWYRIVNNEIVNSICFFSRWANIPLMLEIGYGIHPLFLKPFNTNDVYISARPDDERFYTTAINESGPVHKMAPFAPEVLVYAPQTDGRGIYTFNEILLAQMDSIQTIEQCYRFHRKMFHSQSYGLSPTMIDEAIYLDETTAFPNCKRAAEKLASICRKKCELNPNKKEYKDLLFQLQLQQLALSDNRREEYLLFLQQRKSKTITWFEKHGIPFDKA